MTDESATEGDDTLDPTARFECAVREGRFAAALSAATSDIMGQLQRVLQRDGYTVYFQRAPETAEEFFGAIGESLEGQIEAEGEEVAHSLLLGHDLAGALLTFQQLLKRRPPEGVLDADALGEVLLQAMRIGARAEHLGLTVTGHFDEFARLKAAESDLKEKQRAAAMRTNATRNQPKESALREAVRICEMNPTLSNEALAEKVRKATQLVTTVRTMTAWVAQWRRSGRLPPRR